MLPEPRGIELAPASWIGDMRAPPQEALLLQFRQQAGSEGAAVTHAALSQRCDEAVPMEGMGGTSPPGPGVLEGAQAVVWVVHVSALGGGDSVRECWHAQCRAWHVWSGSRASQMLN